VVEDNVVTQIGAFMKVLRPILALSIAALPWPSNASDGKLEETALSAGCVPSRVEAMDETGVVDSWMIYCVGDAGKKIVVTCYETVCRAEPANDIESDDRIR
jgi:hypothetical protein